MDTDAYSRLPLALPSSDLVKCCDCGCSCYLGAGVSSGSWFRTVKRKYDELEGPSRFFVPGLDLALNPNARVQIENECDALRETLSSQQAAIQDLYTELEEERNASSSAANEAMSMILRLQREKAEVQMEARQFKRFAEEKMAHDQQELLAMEDLLYKREQVIQSLTCEVQAYKHRMLSYGLTESEIEGEKGGGFSRNTSMTENLDGVQFDFPVYDYPPLKCSLNENPTAFEGDDDDIIDIEKYAPGETPRARNLKNLEYRIYQMEKTPRSNQMNSDLSGSKNVLEKVIVGHSPRRPKHNRRFSVDSSNSFFGETREICNDIGTGSPNFRVNNSFKKMDYFPKEEEHPTTRKLDNASEFADDMSDRVYTIDSVHNGPTSTGAAEPKPGPGAFEDYLSAPREPDFSDPDIKKLYARLHALEADRESMRQAIISMRTDKAQLVLLKEIAQHLCKDMSPERPMPIKKPTVVRSFRIISVFKWVASFIFWRKAARQHKNMFGISASSAGLLMLLDKSPRSRQWRCLSSTQV